MSEYQENTIHALCTTEIVALTAVLKVCGSHKQCCASQMVQQDRTALIHMLKTWTGQLFCLPNTLSKYQLPLNMPSMVSRLGQWLCKPCFEAKFEQIPLNMVCSPHLAGRLERYSARASALSWACHSTHRRSAEAGPGPAQTAAAGGC